MGVHPLPEREWKPGGLRRRTRRRRRRSLILEIHTKIAVNAPAGAAWGVLGERFGDISEWASATTSSKLAGEVGEGQMRTCHIGGIGGVGPMELHERLVEFDRAWRPTSHASVESSSSTSRLSARRERQPDFEPGLSLHHVRNPWACA